MPKPKETPKRVKDVLGDDLWSEYPKVDIDNLLGEDIIIVDFVIRDGQYGNFAIILVRHPETQEMRTSSCGGETFLKRLTQLREKNAFPILGQVVIPEGKRYYNII